MQACGGFQDGGEREMMHDTKVEITCDGENCSESITIDTTALAGGGCDTRYAETEVEQNHWLWVSEDEHYCEDCRERREGK